MDKLISFTDDEIMVLHQVFVLAGAADFRLRVSDHSFNIFTNLNYDILRECQKEEYNGKNLCSDCIKI